MKVKTLIKKLQKLPPEYTVEFMTAIGQYGRVTGVAIGEGAGGCKYVRLDVVEDEKSFDTNYL